MIKCLCGSPGDFTGVIETSDGFLLYFSSLRHGLHSSPAMFLPLPFRRGEGRGEGWRCVVHPTVRPICAQVRNTHHEHSRAQPAQTKL
jgi:hypothetical protein